MAREMERGQRILNPVTNIEIGENSVFTLDTVQIKGVDSTIRTTNVVMDANSKLFVLERLMTDGDQKAESDIEVCMNGSGSSAQIISRSVGKGNSSQVFHPKAVGKTNATPYPVRFYHHGSRPGRIYSGDPGKACGCGNHPRGGDRTDQ